jgi:hypothetical protein
MIYSKLDPNDPAVIAKYLLGEEDTKNEGATTQKVFNNIDTLTLVADGKGYIVYLDGINSRTTRIAYDMGIQMSRCIAITNQQEAYDNLAEYQTHGLTAYLGNFFDVIEKLSKDVLENLDVVWYDGCGTVLGSIDKKIHPCNDVEKLLKLADCNFMLVMTFSFRARHRRRPHFSLMQNEDSDSDTEVETPYKRRKTEPRGLNGYGINTIEQKNIIKTIIKRNGYTYTKKLHKLYRPMYFWAVNISKILKAVSAK